MVGSLPIGRVSPQMSLQPSPMAKAAVKERSPCEEMAVFSTPSCELDMSTYGATCPTEALAGAAETIAASIKPEAASSTEDPAATRRGLPRRRRTLIPTPPFEIPQENSEIIRKLSYLLGLEQIPRNSSRHAYDY